ncbi:FAD-binding oxidoreductase [Thermomonospora cellulosilytica]|uniref:FAD/FMN-containing dehydrogenase n=1 Tax=Thermomonospora cellulosilytica TaxID=1411118 RepID=A0A7W3N4N5_9ACTN|nr:FAD-binding oxidoreductase [Thermomonospora cellulosilytica]MBA9007494.1 FAD/FMN-containing dehydrogenase [Thermomonospora cellulosilytica]
MERRGFLAAAGLAALAAGCDGGAPPRTAPTRTRAASPAVTGPADWRALEEGLAGRLIRPGDDAYDEARRLYIPRFDRIRPAGIAYCAGPEDVRECLAFARRRRLPVAVRCGGHGYAGWSTGSGLVIDVSAMDNVRVEGGRAMVGAGTRLIGLYEGLAKEGVAVPAGTCPTVGIAGLALGGGLGVTARRYGLTCDVMEAVQVVTADGRILDCDARREPDLFWACRGGGGGNFGVATSFTFRAYPADEVSTFALRWPWRNAGRVIAAWQSWAPAAPDELWSGLQLNTEPSTGTPALDVIGVSFGDPGPQLDRLAAAVRADPSSRGADRKPYLDAMRQMGGCSGDACHRAGTLPGTRPDGRYPRTEYTAKSHVAARPLPGPAIDALVGAFTEGNDVAGRSVLLDALGGAVGRVRPGDTAFPHRRALFTVQYIADTGDRRWLRDLHAAMEPYAGGAAYVNYVDPELRGWRRAYYGGNYERLARVKRAYDPEGLFRFPQSIG